MKSTHNQVWCSLVMALSVSACSSNHNPPPVTTPPDPTLPAPETPPPDPVTATACPKWECGQNSPYVNGWPVEALHLRGDEPRDGFRLVGFRSSTGQEFRRTSSSTGTWFIDNSNPPRKVRFEVDRFGNFSVHRPNGDVVVDNRHLKGSMLLVRHDKQPHDVPIEFVGISKVRQWKRSCGPPEYGSDIPPDCYVTAYDLRTLAPTQPGVLPSWLKKDRFPVINDSNAALYEQASSGVCRDTAGYDKGTRSTQWGQFWRSDVTYSSGSSPSFQDTVTVDYVDYPVKRWHAQASSYNVVLIGGETYDSETAEIDSETRDSRQWFNIACAGNALAKMKLMGYEPMTHKTDPNYTTPQQRQATLKMLTAKYCPGMINAESTQQGQPLAWFGAKGWFEPWHHARAVEALWDENGAICLNKPRFMPRDSVDQQCAGYQDNLKPCDPILLSNTLSPTAHQYPASLIQSHDDLQAQFSAQHNIPDHVHTPPLPGAPHHVLYPVDKPRYWASFAME